MKYTERSYCTLLRRKFWIKIIFFKVYFALTFWKLTNMEVHSINFRIYFYGCNLCSLQIYIIKITSHLISSFHMIFLEICNQETKYFRLKTNIKIKFQYNPRCPILFLGTKSFVTPISYINYFHVIHFCVWHWKLHEHEKFQRSIINTLNIIACLNFKNNQGTCLKHLQITLE